MLKAAGERERFEASPKRGRALGFDHGEVSPLAYVLAQFGGKGGGYARAKVTTVAGGAEGAGFQAHGAVELCEGHMPRLSASDQVDGLSHARGVAET